MRYLSALFLVFCILAAGLSACSTPDTMSLVLDPVDLPVAEDTFAPAFLLMRTTIYYSRT